jgi:EpsD family peptidyl-prolyl cis-trans isomerase
MYVVKKLLVTLVVSALVVGCGDKEEAAGTEKPSTQVAAKVNDTELTMHQINYALQRLPNLKPEQTKEASFQVLKALVDQEVFVQKAMADKLDRDPLVVQALDASRRQLLTEAYIARKIGSPAEPGEAEILEYFNSHPELFTKRKLYGLQELSIKAPKEKQEAIRQKLASSATLNDFVAWLKAENYETKAKQGVKPAEELPLNMLPKLAGMSKGQAMAIPLPEGLLVLVLVNSQDQPVTLAQAKTAIANLLKTQARQKAIRAELDALKAATKIEYVGEFVDAGKEPAAPAATQTPAAGATPATSESKAPDTDAEAISKGVSGL